MKTLDITGALLEAKGEQMERPQWGERGRDQVKSVGNTVVREKLLEVMLAEGFLKCGMSYNTHMLVCTAILLDCLQPLEKVCSTHWLLIVDAIQKYLTEHRAPFYNWVSLAGGGRAGVGRKGSPSRKMKKYRKENIFRGNRNLEQAATRRKWCPLRTDSCQLQARNLCQGIQCHP